LESFESLGGKAFSPASDGVAIAIELVGDILIGRLAWVRREQNDATAECQGLWRGACADESFELGAEFGLQFDGRAKGTGHGNILSLGPCRLTNDSLAIRTGLDKTTGSELVKRTSSYSASRWH
jgi:hypothetical protein